jgi:glucose-6-phosphate isomerase
MGSSSLWHRFQNYFLRYDDLDFSIDISRMKFSDEFFDKMQPRVGKALAAMCELEAGATANPDKKRMVGHYWLRNPAVRADVEETNERIKKFAADVHAGKIVAEDGKQFQHILLIGIGGSALGPQFIADALGSTRDPMASNDSHLRVTAGDEPADDKFLLAK